MNIGEYCPEQYIILYEFASSIWYIASDNIHAITLLSYSNKLSIFYINIVYFIIFNWNIELHIHIACKYRDILHDYFPLKLIGKYLLLHVYNKPNYSHYSLYNSGLEPNTCIPFHLCLYNYGLNIRIILNVKYNL